ncbi:MAG: hypothetical protein ABSH06_16020 [Thermodesulfobacteriota bacterium]|jgi:UDP-galactopyranose mutase
MKQFVAVLLVFILLGCAHNGAFSMSSEEKVREYSSTVVTLSDFSMKIVAYYQSQNLSVPKDFDTQQFFALLEKIYPDQSRVKFIQNNYQVSVRSLNGGYSVMLCDPKTNQKIMEDLSCHLDRVEIRSWESTTSSQCVFENNWKPYCE